MRVKLLPYNMASKSAAALSKALKCQRVHPDRNYRPQAGDVVINWGNCNNPSWNYAEGVRRSDFSVLNVPSNVDKASCKDIAFMHLARGGVPTVDWTPELDVAATWLDEGETVVERHLLRSHSGKGIRLCGGEFDLRRAPLYTKYQRKTHEYRVHVMARSITGSGGYVTTLNQKRRRMEVPADQVNWKIRNFDNGFAYCRDNVDHNQAVLDQAVRAIRSLGLHYGAVDVLYHEPSDKVAVLEVNTAPGLEGSLLEWYADNFTTLLNRGQS